MAAEPIIVQLANGERNYIRVYKDFFRCKLLNAKEKMVYIGLKDFLNYKEDSGDVFPSIITLANNCGMDRKTVISTIKSLEKKGVIKKEHRGLTKTNLYTLYDNPGMWEADTVEEMQTMAETTISLSTEELLEELKRRGAIQVIDKEKELKSKADQSKDLSPKKNSNSITNDSTTNTAISQENVYSKEFLTDLYERESFVLNYPDEIKDYDFIIKLIFDTVNSNAQTVKIDRKDKELEIVKNQLLKLDYEDIHSVIVNFDKVMQTEKIRSKRAYLLTMLYHAKEDGYFENKNIGKLNGDF